MSYFDPEIKKIHMIGIGGISMSALAKILNYQGYDVSGSDFQESSVLDELRALGMTIYKDHHKENVQDVDYIIYTSAIHADNAELEEARAKGIPTMNRGEFMGLLTSHYKHSIAISGTHGKTTTTTMASMLLHDTDLDPMLLIGAQVDQLGGNLVLGKGDIILNEACEYYRSFLDFDYSVAVILNIEEDHLDYFKDLDDITKTFLQFANKTRDGGCVILNIDDPETASLKHAISKRVITTSLKGDADFKAKNIHYSDKGFPIFDLYIDGVFIKTMQLSIPGEHNVSNALAAIAAAHQVSDVKDHLHALESLKGAKRRMDHRGSFQGAILIEDYAHHPSEIYTTLSAIRKMYVSKKIHVVFQPHTYTRTLKLFRGFLHAFDEADEVILTDIYAAREKDIYQVSSADLAEAIQEEGQLCKYYPTMEEVSEVLTDTLSSDDVLVVMGAGDIYKLFDYL